MKTSCGISSLWRKAILMAVVILLVVSDVHQYFHKKPPSLLFCWQEDNPLVNKTTDITVCDLDKEDQRFPSCQLPPDKHLLMIWEANENLEKAYLNVKAFEESFRELNSDLFNTLLSDLKRVQQFQAAVEKKLEIDATKVRICKQNETEGIFFLALFIILIDFTAVLLELKLPFRRPSKVIPDNEHM